MQAEDIHVFSTDTINKHMSKIISMFDNEAADREIIEKELAIVKTISDTIKNFSSETFFLNFSNLAREDLVDFVDKGVIVPTNYPIKAHLRGLLKVLDDNNNSVQTLFKNYTKDEQKIKEDSKRFDVDVNIIEELTLINNLFPYNSKKKAWKFPTFVLEHTNSDGKKLSLEFPGLYFYFDFSRKDVDSGCEIAIDKKTVRYERGYSRDSSERYFHPHINTDMTICLGDAAAAAQLFWERKELLNLALLLQDTLGTYNDSSPYKKLYHWADKKLYKCNNCTREIDENHVFFIDEDKDIPACSDCSLYIDNLSSYQWKANCVRSELIGKFIPKTSATFAWTDDTHRDFIHNILANPQFCSCPGCNEFVDIDYMHNATGAISKCIRCRNGEISTI